MCVRDEIFVRILLVVASTLTVCCMFTLVANFGWTHISSLASYVLTIVIGYVIYLLWKN